MSILDNLHHIAEEIGDFLNELDILDDQLLSVVNPVFDLLNSSPDEDEITD